MGLTTRGSPRGVAVVVAPLLLLLLMLAVAGLGCRGSLFGGEELTDPDRATAEYAWKQTRKAAPQTPRYAFYPQAGRTYTELSARAFRSQRPFDQALRNDRGQLATLLDDSEFAIYVAPTGERVAGAQWRAHRESQQRDLRASNDDDDDDETSRSAERDAFFQDSSASDSSERAPKLPRPTRVVGTLLMFANPREALALGVYDDPNDPRDHWYLVVEGARGDRAYYRLGDLARLYLEVATRQLGRRTR